MLNVKDDFLNIVRKICSKGATCAYLHHQGIWAKFFAQKK